jgi:D-3-phosphoglycerate dehydrogenase / 2-oxoglutarate reductase
MKKILANDGLESIGVELLKNAVFEVSTNNVEQSVLIDHINKNQIEVLTVRSATKVRKDLIDACPSLKVIGRGGVGMDNIDVDYAKSKGIAVVNTPAASSYSVAELVIGSMFGMARFLYDSNRQMPINGTTDFKKLKNKYAGGIELRGKTLGIIGFGRIGKVLAEYALGIGMTIKFYDTNCKETFITLKIGDENISVKLSCSTFEDLISTSDFISLHVPGGEVITEKEILQMKNGVFLINTARGGVINEEDLLKYLDNGKIAAATLDVFNNEPTPNERLLKHPKISLTPHIGAATEEAQNRIAIELAEKIISKF